MMKPFSHFLKNSPLLPIGFRPYSKGVRPREKLQQPVPFWGLLITQLRLCHCTRFDSLFLWDKFVARSFFKLCLGPSPISCKSQKSKLTGLSKRKRNVLACVIGKSTGKRQSWGDPGSHKMLARHSLFPALSSASSSVWLHSLLLYKVFLHGLGNMT